ncbi:MAG: fluoride efflux transporter CrcB [Chitinophagaceae bacterium]|nr:MAG: fluoride efflux transporter CrcB [Chitinophagaceae bacterium]
MIRSLLWVGLGGAAGSMLRFGLQRWLNDNRFPWGTLGVNIAGCLAIGILWSFAARGQAGAQSRALLMSGFCGGFTTLSAFSHESNLLLQEGRSTAFFFYAAATMLGGLLATFVGYKAFAP